MIEIEDEAVKQIVILQSHSHIGHEREKPRKRIETRKALGCPLDIHNGDPCNYHRKVIKRKYPQRPPFVKIGKIMRFPARIEQNSGNKEAGKNKKQIHANPAALSYVKAAIGRPVVAQRKVTE